MRRVIFIFFSVMLISPNLSAMQVEAENISSEKYFESALKELNSAKISVVMAMYLISSLPDQPNSQPNQLLNALIRAKDRGVQVKVILDQNINFEAESTEEALYKNKNQQAYEVLRKNNDGTWRHKKIILSPENKRFENIILENISAEHFRVIAELVAVL